MPDFRYPFKDAVITVSNVGEDRTGRQRGVVAVQTPDLAGFIALPREQGLFEDRDWAKLVVDAAGRNGHNRSGWLARTQQVRAALWEDLKQGTITLERLAETDVAAVGPLPEIVWQGIFKQYRATAGPTTEAPDVFHYFCLAVGMGATLGRRAWVHHAVPLFPNFYVALVGRTGMARKDTARSRVNRMLQELHYDQNENEDPQFLILPGIGATTPRRGPHPAPR